MSKKAGIDIANYSSASEEKGNARNYFVSKRRRNNAAVCPASSCPTYYCVEPEALRFCFDLACRQTLAEGCELHLDTPAAVSWCHDCQRDITLLMAGVLLCPDCGGRRLRVIADDGMKIKRIEIE